MCVYMYMYLFHKLIELSQLHAGTRNTILYVHLYILGVLRLFPRYTYIYIYIYIYIYVYTYIYKYMYFVYTYIFIYIYVRTYISVYEYI